MNTKSRVNHIILTSHPNSRHSTSIPIQWGAKSAALRGPVVATLSKPAHRNCIGAHSGAYAIYNALAIASGALNPLHVPDLTNTAPPDGVKPNPNWFDPEKIISFDPFGADIHQYYQDYLRQGYNIRPTIAVTRAHVNLPEITDAISKKRLTPDGNILLANGDCRVTKAAIEPVWFLPGIAKRFNIEEMTLRRCLFEYTGGMFTELITRPDLLVFLPPIGGLTLYCFGNIHDLSDPNKKVAVRIHDECNGSDVFGSDICTCRPYLTHGIEVCMKTAQEGGVGLIVYNRKEGRALGEVTKFLVYNARKRQVGGDRAEQYFLRTECVAGVQDMRFQELMPDVLLWLGVQKIDQLVSMSNFKFDALVKAGISIQERVSIPDALIPQDAQVEMDAKRAAGYYSTAEKPNSVELTKAKGRKLDQ